MSDNAYATAFKLLTLGYSVIPSGAGPYRKAPLVKWQERQQTPADESQLDQWQTELQPKLWGIVTNDKVAVIEADTPQARTELEAELGQPNILSPRGGAHWYCDTTGHPLKTIAGLLPGIDVRGVGGFINIAGSSKFGEYKILRLPIPGELLPWGKLPKRILAALNRIRPVARTTTTPGTPIPKTQRNATLASLAGSMRRRSMTQTAIEAALLETNKAQCSPPLPEDEVLTIAKSISQYETGEVTFNLTDMGNANRLIARHGENLRFCYELGLWLVWNGKMWAKDTGAELMTMAKETISSIYPEIANITDSQSRKELAKHACQSESETRLQAMISLSKDLVPISIKDLDSNTMLFNCQNGIIDLRTGTLNPHKREDYLTQISPVEYLPAAESPLWQQHLKRITGNNSELIAYLQRVFGYCLTGQTKEQSIFFIFGQTKTGKSKTIGAIMHVLGDYARLTPSETLLIKRNGGHKDTARLVGSRIVVAVENEKGEKLASALIKQLTGGDRMAARFLYKENFEFEPTFKIFLVANDKPKIRGEDSAMWERIKLVPFQQFIPVNERDKDIGEKLKEEAEGILAWMLKGCLEWLKRGDLLEPDIVTAETKIYRNEMDILADFIDDCCLVERTAKVAHGDLYQAYEEWCRQNDEEPITKKMLTIELQSRNFVAKRGHAGKKVWHGLALKGYQEGDSGDTCSQFS